MLHPDRICSGAFTFMSELNGENIIGRETCVFVSPQCLAFRIPKFDVMLVCLMSPHSLQMSLYLVDDIDSPDDDELGADWQVTTDELWYSGDAIEVLSEHWGRATLITEFP